MFEMKSKFIFKSDFVCFCFWILKEENVWVSKCLYFQNRKTNKSLALRALKLCVENEDNQKKNRIIVNNELKFGKKYLYE